MMPGIPGGRQLAVWLSSRASLCSCLRFAVAAVVSCGPWGAPPGAAPRPPPRPPPKLSSHTPVKSGSFATAAQSAAVGDLGAGGLGAGVCAKAAITPIGDIAITTAVMMRRTRVSTMRRIVPNPSSCRMPSSLDASSRKLLSETHPNLAERAAGLRPHQSCELALYDRIEAVSRPLVKRSLAIAVVLVLGLADARLDVRAQESKRTFWDGVFNDAQATRGQNVYKQSCAPCHKADLLGDTGAPRSEERRVGREL